MKSAIDIACWDILGKATGLPVCELLGGRRPGDVTVQSSIPTADPPEMLRTIERFDAKGYTVHSAKVESNVAEDIERIRYLAERMPAGSFLTIDANRAWIPDQAIRVMQKLRRGSTPTSSNRARPTASASKCGAPPANPSSSTRSSIPTPTCSGPTRTGPARGSG